MKSVSISGSLRENVGKKDAKAQRAKGLVPCVLYGGKQQYQFVVEENQFKQLIYTPEVLYANLELDGKQCNAIIQASQFHAITDQLLHVDFLEIVEGKPITIGIPVKVAGTSPGVLRGGKLAKKVRKLKVKGELQHIPEYIEVDISSLEINEYVKVGDISIPNITVVENPANVVVTVQPTRNMEAAATETEA
ncbi:MAG: 50S ribosomal protein L25/general stress protein Ctc [Bacteroidales bacterium]|jgi:large subunit ribosomal protein L25|nr:50S ribosomal protein L25/general stress protein Ctc [Bacteroidales bacterium]